MNPALNIIDGLVGQAGSEWGRGDHPRICNTLIAGDHVVATDACSAALMGHDPGADWPLPPYHRDRNPLLVAAEGGFGAVNLGQIDWQSEVTAPVGEFFSIETDPRQIVASWLRTTAEQALYYRDHQAEFEKRYAGHYILLQMGQVRWFGADVTAQASRRCQVRRTRGAGWRWTASLRWSEIYQDGRMSEDSIERFAVARAQLTPVSLR